MSVLIPLLLLGAFIASGFLLAFLWAMKSGQFEDLDTPSIRILHDED